jgi:hypothetical protein
MIKAKPYKLFSLDEAKELGLTIYQLRDYKEKWVKHNLDVILFQPNSNIIPTATFVEPCMILDELIVDDPHIQLGIDEDQAVFLNLTTETIIFKVVQPAGFLISASIQPGSLYSMNASKLVGKKDLMLRWNIQNSDIEGTTAI